MTQTLDVITARKKCLWRNNLFHLKIFKTDGVHVEKIDKHIDFPLELDLRPYTICNQNNDVSCGFITELTFLYLYMCSLSCLVSLMNCVLTHFYADRYGRYVIYMPFLCILDFLLLQGITYTLFVVVQTHDTSWMNGWCCDLIDDAQRSQKRKIFYFNLGNMEEVKNNTNGFTTIILRKTMEI